MAYSPTILHRAAVQRQVPKNREFTPRLIRGERFERKVAESISNLYDCRVIPWGAGTYTPELRRDLKNTKNSERDFAAYMPDLLVTSRHKWVFLDAKSTLGNTGFYSVSLPESETQKKLPQIFNVNLLHVFCDPEGGEAHRAEYIERIKFSRVVTSSDHLAICDGSQLQFGLIPVFSTHPYTTLLDQLLPRKDGSNLEKERDTRGYPYVSKLSPNGLRGFA